MRSTFRILLLLLAPLLLAAPLLAPTGAASTCVVNPELSACVGNHVLSSDCRVGAVRVNGVFAGAPSFGGILAGEVFWHLCFPGYDITGHSIEVLSQGWYDIGFNGAHTCGVYTSVAGQETDCGLGPPYLPTLP